MTKAEMLNMILDYKACFYSEDSEEYLYWKDYLITLNEHDLKAELLDHFLITEEIL